MATRKKPEQEKEARTGIDNPDAPPKESGKLKKSGKLVKKMKKRLPRKEKKAAKKAANKSAKKKLAKLAH